MDFVTIEEEISFLDSPVGFFIRFEGFDVSGINGEGEFIFFDKGRGLSNEIREDGDKFIWTESFSEVVEGGVGGCITKLEATEEGEPCVVFEFVGEVSFGVGEAKVDEEERFEEGDWAVAMSTFWFIGRFNDFVYEGDVNGLEEYFKRVILWDEILDFKVNKRELNMFFHVSTPFGMEDKGRWGYMQGGGGVVWDCMDFQGIQTPLTGSKISNKVNRFILFDSQKLK